MFRSAVSAFQKNHSYSNLSDFAVEFLKEFTPAIRKGSVSFLSVVNHDLLSRMVSQPEIFFDNFGVESASYYEKYSQLQDIKKAFFDSTLKEIYEGNFDLITQLAKGVTDSASFGTYLNLVRKHQESLRNNQLDRNLLIYPGSFDPMHYGHRVMIASLLERLEPTTQLAVNINSYQARKPHLEATYEHRFANLEYRLLKSALLDPYRVCVMDFRFGAKEHEDHLRQTRLQSYMAGDSRLRWVIGGDKFLSEVTRKQEEEDQGIIGRTLSRFYLKSMSIYIVPRKGQDKQKLQDLAQRMDNAYPAEFVCIEEKEYEGRPISSTLIRTYNKKPDLHLKAEAKRMEGSDLTREYV